VTQRRLQHHQSFLSEFTAAARDLAEKAHEPGLASATVGKRQYGRWLQGGLVNRPREPSSRVLEHMFGHTVNELFGLTDEAPVTVAPRRQRDEARLTPAALEAIEVVRRRMDTALSDQGDIELLEEWERRLDDYTHVYMVAPPAHLLRDALLDFTDVQSALKLGQYGGQRERLWQLSARLAGMIGVFLYVLGEHKDARAWFHTGDRAARYCHDGNLEAWMHARSAIVSLHYGTPRFALMLADKAAALHRGPSGAAVRTQIVRARALARLGDRVNAWGALNAASSAFESLDDGETSNKVFGHTERQFLAHSANTLTSLRDTRAATRLREQALAAFAGHDSAEHLDPALARIDEGLCLLWEADPTAACHHVMAAIAELPREHRTGLVGVSAHAFFVTLTPAQRRLRAGVELKESLRSAFGATEQPRL
jgi:hypothetical protein